MEAYRTVDSRSYDWLALQKKALVQSKLGESQACSVRNMTNAEFSIGLYTFLFRNSYIRALNYDDAHTIALLR